MKTLIISCLTLFIWFQVTFSLPMQTDPRVILVPISVLPPNQQLRGPLDFIGNWIQSSSFFPIEINVPDTFSSVGNTVGGWASNVGNFAQNVGSNVQGFTQNVGNGIQNFAQSLTQRVPLLGAFIRPNGSSTQRFVFLIPTQNLPVNYQDKNNVGANFDMGSDMMDIFP